jgi:cysteinyl-tRNA synthetase, unknown class
MTTAQIIVLLLVLAGIAFLIHWFTRGSSPETPVASSKPAAPRKATTARPSVAPTATGDGLLSGVTSWGYQLQNLNVSNAAASPFDLLVVDYAKDGSDDSALTPAELARLKTKPDGHRRVMLAYLSIGEAEDYRSYWDPSWKRAKPSWLLAENKEWKGNYAVCFWEPGWQGIICGDANARIDRLIAAGFDGVYLDKCDVYEDLRRKHKHEAASRPDIEADMIAFVRHLSVYAKAKKPGFLVVMQNAENLLSSLDLRAALDGAAKEELIFGVDSPEKHNSADDVAFSRAQFDLLHAEGKPIFVVEYLNAPAKIQDATNAITPLGYILYVSDKNRSLKKLNYDVLDA